MDSGFSAFHNNRRFAGVGFMPHDVYFALKLTETKPPTLSVIKIIAATAIMGIVGFFIPKTTLFLFPGIILCMIVYFFALILVKFFAEEDIDTLRGYASKLGPLAKFINKLLNLVEKLEFRN